MNLFRRKSNDIRSRLEKIEQAQRCINGEHNYIVDCDHNGQGYITGYIIRCDKCREIMKAERLAKWWAIPTSKEKKKSV